MLNSVRRFDLYDFFSVLLPGTAFLLGLAPFLPTSSGITSLGVVLPVLAAGFVVGRSFHSAAVIIEKRHESVDENAGIIRNNVVYPIFGTVFAHDWENDISHRRKFVKELTSPDDINQEIVDSYRATAERVFEEVDVPGELDDIDEDFAESLYSLTRSYIHVDARGRSRTFQAVYAFYRSMWLVSLTIAVIYILYGISTLTNTTVQIAEYTSLIGSLGIPGLVISIVGFVVAIASYYTFSSAKRDYQRLYVEYLFVDLIVLESDMDTVQVAIQSALNE